MGVYVYAIRKSKPIRGVAGIDDWLHRCVFVTRASALEDNWDMNKAHRRARHHVKLALQSSERAWHSVVPRYAVFAEDEKDGLYTVLKNVNKVIWYDCDKLPGEEYGFLFIQGKEKRFITREMLHIYFKQTTGQEWNGHGYGYRKVSVIPGHVGSDVVIAYCKMCSISYSLANTVAAGLEKMAECI